MYCIRVVYVAVKIWFNVPSCHHLIFLGHLNFLYLHLWLERNIIKILTRHITEPKCIKLTYPAESPEWLNMFSSNLLAYYYWKKSDTKLNSENISCIDWWLISTPQYFFQAFSLDRTDYPPTSIGRICILCPWQSRHLLYCPLYPTQQYGGTNCINLCLNTFTLTGYLYYYYYLSYHELTNTRIFFASNTISWATFLYWPKAVFEQIRSKLPNE